MSQTTLSQEIQVPESPQTTIYQTTAPTLPLSLLNKLRKLCNIFKTGDGIRYGRLLTYTQLLIIYIILKRKWRRVILILPTQYGKSLAVAFGVLLRVSSNNEKWAIIAPTEEKARIIMDYVIEHVFDHDMFIEKLEYTGTKEKLKQERSKTRLTFRGGGEIRVYTANANNSQAVKKALMGFGSPNIILDESSLIPDDLYSTIKRMLGGTVDNFMLEIGNPFFKNHFWRTWVGSRYVRIFCDYLVALKEGRYSLDYIDEMREEAFFDILYECHFPADDDETPPGYHRLLSDSFLENAMIDNEIPLPYDQNGKMTDKPILGIDPNHGGSNYTVMTVRYPKAGFAKVVLKKQYADTKDVTGEIIADAIKIIKEYGIADYRTAVDAGGVGAGVADGLEAQGYLIVPVLFGESAEDKSRYVNIKAELFWDLRKWIRTENGKLLRNDGFLELKVINYKEATSGKTMMEPKEKLIARKVASPDTADSLALTFINTSDIVEEDDVVVMTDELDDDEDDDDII